MNLVFLGAPEDVDVKAWDAYFIALRNKLQQTFAEMLGAYRALKKIRESFGLPVVGTSGEAKLRVGALNDSEYQQMLELTSMVDLMTKALDDVVAGKRKVGYDRATNDFQIERLSGDSNRIEIRNGAPTLISNQTNQPVQITGSLDGLPNSLGIAPIVWAGLIVAGVVVTVGALYTVNTAMESATAIVQSDMQKTIAMKSMELVEQGKATPEQAKQLSTATYEAAANLKRAEGETKGLTPDTNKTIRTVALVALGVGGLYLISKVVPNREPRVVAA